jgi:N-methylhydantoinase B
MVVYTPFFWESKLLCFLAVRAHWIDVGGASTGFGSSMTRDVYEEGLQIRSVKIYAEGKPNVEILRLIEDNIRFPESSLGDLRAQIACCRTGEERLEQICRKYGEAVFQEAVEVIWNQTDTLVREAVRGIPTEYTRRRRFSMTTGRILPKRFPSKFESQSGTTTSPLTSPRSAIKCRGLSIAVLREEWPRRAWLSRRLRHRIGK